MDSFHSFKKRVILSVFSLCVLCVLHVSASYLWRPELDLQAVMASLTWVLRIKLRSSIGVASL